MLAADAALLLRHQGDRRRAGGIFDRTLAALVRDGVVLKVRDGYLLASDGSAIEPEETRAGSGIRVYCSRCGGSHPNPDKGSGETFEDVHNRDIAP